MDTSTIIIIVVVSVAVIMAAVGIYLKRQSRSSGPTLKSGFGEKGLVERPLKPGERVTVIENPLGIGNGNAFTVIENPFESVPRNGNGEGEEEEEKKGRGRSRSGNGKEAEAETASSGGGKRRTKKRVIKRIRRTRH